MEFGSILSPRSEDILSTVWLVARGQLSLPRDGV